MAFVIFPEQILHTNIPNYFNNLRFETIITYIMKNYMNQVKIRIPNDKGVLNLTWPICFVHILSYSVQGVLNLTLSFRKYIISVLINVGSAYLYLLKIGCAYLIFNGLRSANLHQQLKLRGSYLHRSTYGNFTLPGQTGQTISTIVNLGSVYLYL